MALWWSSKVKQRGKQSKSTTRPLCQCDIQLALSANMNLFCSTRGYDRAGCAVSLSQSFYCRPLLLPHLPNSTLTHWNITCECSPFDEFFWYKRAGFTAEMQIYFSLHAHLLQLFFPFARFDHSHQRNSHKKLIINKLKKRFIVITQ